MYFTKCRVAAFKVDIWIEWESGNAVGILNWWHHQPLDQNLSKSLIFIFF